jgi:cyclic pyranopterin phosphate synthase
LRSAGLTRLNISIDSLQESRFSELTRGGKLSKVLDGIDSAYDAGFGSESNQPIKLNAVILPDKNDDELMDFIEFCSEHPAHIEPRFIEYMPFNQRWHSSKNTQTLLEKLQQNIPLIPIQTSSNSRGPARQYLAPTHNVTIGFISPISQPFCSTCNRLRLSAHGELRACLAKDHYPALRDVIRNPHTPSDIHSLIQRIVSGKVKGHQCGDEQKSPIPFEGIMTQIGG